jgi:hypothetical protein
MPPSVAPHTAGRGSTLGRVARWILALATAGSFLLVFHNYGSDVFPSRRVPIPPGGIRPYSGEATFAYVFDFKDSEPDLWPSVRSRVNVYEDAQRYRLRLHQADEVLLVGGDRFAHEPGRIVFSTTDNTDPRTNGRHYSLTTPILYRPAIGDGAMIVFLYCAAAWCLLFRGSAPARGPPGSGRSHWRWHLAGATALFLFGLYCNTGTLAPYGNTCAPMYISPATGYVYNQDNPYFRVLFDFVDGKDRSVWDHAELLRRILFPFLGWPLMRLFGFEIGGTLTSLLLNTAAFVAALVFLRRRMGERGAIFAGWILALYPGAAYWAGMPYPYALIFPGSLLLTLGLWRLLETGGGRFVVISLGMGLIYLGYDLAIFFLPATLIALCWRRRFAAAAAAVVLQVAPLACWLLTLKYVFRQSLENANSGIYRSVVSTYLHPTDYARWSQEAVHAAGFGFDIFFASNFIFLPALFLFVLAVNPLTSRIRFHLAETALLVTGLGLFLFLNLAPSDSGGWAMSGTWISRIYQPVFPALALFMARWWQELPPLSWRLWALVLLGLLGATLGNALIVFGPILNDPGHISETAFYRFYDHTDAHFVYEATLKSLGRRPLGFPRPQAPAPTAVEIRAQSRQQLADALVVIDNLRRAIEGNRAALIGNQTAYIEVGRALAAAQSELLSTRLELRQRRGELSADEAKRRAPSWNDLVPPGLRVLLDHGPTGVAGPPAHTPPPQTLSDANAAIRADSSELVELQRAVGQAEAELSRGVSDLSKARDDLARAKSDVDALQGK